MGGGFKSSLFEKVAFYFQEFQHVKVVYQEDFSAFLSVTLDVRLIKCCSAIATFRLFMVKMLWVSTALVIPSSPPIFDFTYSQTAKRGNGGSDWNVTVTRTKSYFVLHYV